MEPPANGTVVLVPFPFSDLSQSKLRPACVLANAGRDDFILCQITSNPYADPQAVELADSDFDEGSLRRMSYARPGKLFTAHLTLIRAMAGTLTADAMRRVVERTVALLQQGSYPE
jgi:mRNA interferase MazF